MAFTITISVDVDAEVLAWAIAGEYCESRAGILKLRTNRVTDAAIEEHGAAKKS